MMQLDSVFHKSFRWLQVQTLMEQREPKNSGEDIMHKQFSARSWMEGAVSGNKGEKTMGKAKGFIDEFKKFIMRGNVMDMAVGVIVGGAFTAIVNSLNQDILTPILGIFGGIDFSNLSVVLGSGENAPVLAYGNFITAVINFLITALVIFCIVKTLNAANAKFIKEEKEEPAAPTTKTCPYCKSEIAIDATRCPHCTSVLEEEA